MTIPASVTSIEGYAFSECSRLSSVLFAGSAPAMDPFVFVSNAPGFSVYYQGGAAGFTSPTWNGYPAAVAEPPVITVQPASQSIANGSTAELAVVATGDPAPSYQWYLGESGDESSPVTGANSATLTTPALISDGSYWVKVSNVLTSANSETVVVTVSPFPYTVSNGEVTITGYTGAGGNLVIPSVIGGLPVVSIGNSAFKDHVDLTEVLIPSGVTSIGDSAFYNCIGLTSVAIPVGVTNIGASAFRKKLTHS